MLDVDRKRTLLDLAQPRCLQQLRKVSLAGAGKLRLILDVRVEVTHRIPERAERPLAVGVIPNACGDDTMLARYARHLAKSHDGMSHEVNDELCQGGVEHLISKRQLLRRGALHADPGMALLGRCHEGC